MHSVVTLAFLGWGAEFQGRESSSGLLEGLDSLPKEKNVVGEPGVPALIRLGKLSCRGVFYFIPSQLSSATRLSGSTHSPAQVPRASCSCIPGGTAGPSDGVQGFPSSREETGLREPGLPSQASIFSPSSHGWTYLCGVAWGTEVVPAPLYLKGGEQRSTCTDLPSQNLQGHQIERRQENASSWFSTFMPWPQQKQKPSVPPVPGCPALQNRQSLGSM